MAFKWITSWFSCHVPRETEERAGPVMRSCRHGYPKSSIRGWNGSWDHKNIDIDTFSIKFGNGDCPHCPLQSIPYPAAKTDPVHAEAVTAKFEQCVFKDVNNNYQSKKEQPPQETPITNQASLNENNRLTRGHMPPQWVQQIQSRDQMCYSGYKVGASLCFKSGNGEFAIPLTEELVHFISASGNGCCERELFNAAISTMQPQDWSIFISTCGEFIPQEIVQIVEDNFAKLGSS